MFLHLLSMLSLTSDHRMDWTGGHGLKCSNKVDGGSKPYGLTLALKSDSLNSALLSICVRILELHDRSKSHGCRLDNGNNISQVAQG